MQDPIKEKIRPLLAPLWQELGLEKLPDEQKEQLSEKLFSVLTDAVSVRMLAAIPEANADPAWIRNMNDDELEALMRKHDLDFFAIVMEEATELRENLLSSVAYAEGYIKAHADKQKSDTEDSTSD